MVVTVTRLFAFDAAHRVWGHESKCRYLHGHRYSCEVTISAPSLDNLGRVVDFGAIKSTIGGWIDDNWDHNCILNIEDPLAMLYQGQGKGFPGLVEEIFQGKAPYLMTCNPTAEEIGKELLYISRNLLALPLEVVGVKVWETPNCYAEVLA